MNHFHLGQDPEEVALLAAEFLRSEIAQFSRYTWALSGGSTPKALYTLLTDRFADSIDWDKVEFFWGDERCVPPSDSESNYHWANQLLLKPLGIDPDQVHRIQGEAEFLGSEVARYSDLIEHVSLYRSGLNLVMLGMGEDGHTLSIFPGQDNIWDSENFSELSIHPGTGQKRITFTGRALKAARSIAFLITGAAKAELLDQIVHRRVGFDQYPASWVTLLSKPVHWFVDREAARYLEIR